MRKYKLIGSGHMFCNDICSRTVTVNGKTVYSGIYSPRFCGMMPMNSCFGIGFGGYMPGFWNTGIGCFYPPIGLEAGIGAGLGMAAGAALVAALPAIGKGLVWVGKGIAKGAQAIGNGVSKLWNKIFHKKSNQA